MKFESLFTEDSKSKSAPAVTALIALLLLCACSSPVPRQSDLNSVYVQTQGELAECAAVFAEADELTMEASARDAQSARLAGFPYLRSNRLLASFRNELGQERKLEAWLMAMRKLDQEARGFELQNAIDHGKEFNIKLDHCGELMLREDLNLPDQIEKIKQASVVADSYIVSNRVLGAYPVSRFFVNMGIRQLHASIKQTFSKPVEALSIRGSLIRYAPRQVKPMSDDELSVLLQGSTSNALSVPSFSASEEESLFNQFAPVWEIDTVKNDDRFGSPYWSHAKKLNILTEDSVVYRHLSYTRLNSQVLPQFNYIIWFPARTATSALDILAGKLDGLTWRVTVDITGRVLMYDVIHNCGCYHMFFPTGDVLMRKPVHSNREESILVPQRGPILKTGERIHLRIAAGSHYIEAVRANTSGPEQQSYRLADYHELRSIDTKTSKPRSMFSDNGIVSGTSRRERWLLWPMGVEDAGAMRQWGHHATAFIGRRHFDDADLLERYFSFP